MSSVTSVVTLRNNERRYQHGHRCRDRINREVTMILDKVNNVQELRSLPQAELPTLAEELRQEIIAVVSKTGGHLASSLGVVDLTIALHYAFDTPNDRIVWDVGHQAYAHKILTGRRSPVFHAPSVRRDQRIPQTGGKPLRPFRCGTCKHIHIRRHRDDLGQGHQG